MIQFCCRCWLYLLFHWTLFETHSSLELCFIHRRVLIYIYKIQHHRPYTIDVNFWVDKRHVFFSLEFDKVEKVGRNKIELYSLLYFFFFLSLFSIASQSSCTVFQQQHTYYHIALCLFVLLLDVLLRFEMFTLIYNHTLERKSRTHARSPILFSVHSHQTHSLIYWVAVESFCRIICLHFCQAEPCFFFTCFQFIPRFFSSLPFFGSHRSIYIFLWIFMYNFWTILIYSIRFFLHQIFTDAFFSPILFALIFRLVIFCVNILSHDFFLPLYICFLAFLLWQLISIYRHKITRIKVDINKIHDSNTMYIHLALNIDVMYRIENIVIVIYYTFFSSFSCSCYIVPIVYNVKVYWALYKYAIFMEIFCVWKS